jgi:2Fe-2S ferredoxin
MKARWRTHRATCPFDDAGNATMPTITYIHRDGSEDRVEAADGVSVMRAALQNGIAGIVGECGGQAMCATCHVYVDLAVELPARSDDEDEMLDGTACERTDESRLGCQLRAGTDFDSLVVRLPERQV